MATTRITDEDMKFIRDARKDGERQEDTLHRLLLQTRSPTITGGNQPIQVNVSRETLQGLADALRPTITREIRTAMESALAGR